MRTWYAILRPRRRQHADPIAAPNRFLVFPLIYNLSDITPPE
jgi:hypothetical protein